MKHANIIILGIAFILSSCVSQEGVRKDIAKMEVAPSDTPKKIITNFSDGLRCMDSMLIEYGVRDISMLVEDLADNTSAVKAGTKDMLITSVSMMTRRSRAVKLIPFGNDSGNLIAFLSNAGAESVYNIIPQYDIRGSISQLDKSVISKQAGGSLAASKWSLGGSKSLAGSILGIDLSVLRTSDLSVIPGVTSSNSVVLFKSGSGVDSDASIQKTGISFEFSVKKNEATVQALRNLIELASIELIGKLVKVPYWRCLGIPETSDEIQQEMQDWYYAMSAHGELIPYLRSLLIARNYYPSSINDEKLAFSNALNSFRHDAGLPPSQKMDYQLFYTLVNGSKGEQLQAVNDREAVNKAVQSPSPIISPVIDKTLNLVLTSASNTENFSPGTPINLIAQSSESAYVYCYLTDSDNNIQRFFPNRFQKDNFIQAGTSLTLPGKMPFDIVANEEGKTEVVDCFATRKNLYSELPSHLKVYDFETIPAGNINDIRNAYQSASGLSAGESTFIIKSRLR